MAKWRAQAGPAKSDNWTVNPLVLQKDDVARGSWGVIKLTAIGDLIWQGHYLYWEGIHIGEDDYHGMAGTIAFNSEGSHRVTHINKIPIEEWMRTVGAERHARFLKELTPEYSARAWHDDGTE